ncbi:MAG TPA: hypothetical protein VKH19_00465 [Gemmatimonadaceae bacterium]|nr:hypothetical protein [Gemmatimonadaceae bacterium]
MPVAVDYVDVVEREQPATFHVNATGAVTLAEVDDLFHEIQTHSRFVPGVRILADARDVSDVPPTSEIRLIAGMLGALATMGLGPVAIVAGNTFVYGVSRMLATLAEPLCVSIQPFRRMDDAMHWLDAEAEARRATPAF